MRDWKKILVLPHTKIRETIQIIDQESMQIAMVVSPEGKLLGTVTDGDIRRGVLNNASLDDPVEKIMNPNPLTIPKIQDRHAVLNILKVNKLRHLPVVDDWGRVVGIQRLEDLINTPLTDNWVVIMAGGLGTRLRPLTNNCPKPMLPLGGKPLLQRILEQFKEQGFNKFVFSVFYMAEQVMDYFGDGEKWGVEIRYLQESDAMGTIGALSLLDINTKSPLVVMNGDILTTLNFQQLLNFHSKHNAKATMAVRIYDYRIPYGVVKVNSDCVIGFEEKPALTSLISAGIYVLDPQLLGRIPKGYYDIHQLFESMLSQGETIRVFPIREYWTDIGDIQEYNRAKLDFCGVLE